MKNLSLKIVSLFLLAFFTGRLIAQDCEPFYVVNKGTVIEMASYDKKDKLTGTTVQTVKEIQTTGNRTEWTIGTVSKDAKGKENSSGDLSMSCEEGIFKMDMKNFVDQETLKGFEGMEVTMDATDLDYPSSLSPGQTLKDGSLTITIASQGTPVMTMVTKIYNRKVVAIEDMTTPAGTFSCYKMTSTLETKTMFSVVVNTTDWIAKRVGTVRSETYDKDGKLASYIVLTSIK